MGVFVMLCDYTAYFDASVGVKDRLPGTWVCGFVSSVSAWSAFEIDWKLALAKFDVPYFHMKDFIANQKPFHAVKWRSELYRARFIATLISIIKSCAMRSIGCGLWHTDFEYMNETYELDSRFNPYAVCGRDCAVRARKFIRENYSDSAPIQFVFDQGDRERRFLIAEMLASKLPEPIFRPSRKLETNPDWVPAVQLQACDFVAWEMRTEGNRRTGLEKGKKLRKSFEALNSIPHDWMHYRRGDIENLCRSAGIARRTEAAWRGY